MPAPSPAGRRGRPGQPPTISLTISSWLVSRDARSPALTPRRSTTMRSATAKMSCRLCEMKMTPRALRLERLDQRDHLALLGHAEGGGRLVHDQELGVPVDRRGRSRPPGAGRRRSARPAPRGGSTWKSSSAMVSLAPPRAIACGRGPAGSRSALRHRLAAEEDVGADRQIVGQRQVLVDRLDAVVAGLLRRREGDRLAVEQDLALVGLVDARDRLDQRRLAGAVVAGQRHAPRRRCRSKRDVARAPARRRNAWRGRGLERMRLPQSLIAAPSAEPALASGRSAPR